MQKCCISQYILYRTTHLEITSHLYVPLCVSAKTGDCRGNFPKKPDNFFGRLHPRKMPAKALWHMGLQGAVEWRRGLKAASTKVMGGSADEKHVGFLLLKRV